MRFEILNAGSPLNPDESEILAQSRAMFENFLPYRNWVTSTSGPFQPWFFWGLNRLGFSTNFYLMHYLSLVIVITYMIFVHLQLRAHVGTFYSLLISITITIPAIMLFPSPSPLRDKSAMWSNFGAFSTELIPILIMLFLIYILQRVDKNYIQFICGISISMIVLLKYQFILVALVYFFQVLYKLRKYHRTIFAPYFILGISTPLTIYLYSILTGDERLVKSHLHFLVNYSSQAPFQIKIQNFQNLMSYEYLIYFLILLYLITFRKVLAKYQFLVLLVPSSLISIFYSGMGFPHYLFLIYYALVIHLILIFQSIDFSTSKKMILFICVTLILVIQFYFAKDLVWNKPNVVDSEFYSNSKSRLFGAESDFSVNSKVQQLCPRNSKVFVWGWAPHLYLSYDWQNASPYVQLQPLLFSERAKTNNYELVSSTMLQSDNTCIIDAIGNPFANYGKRDSLVNYLSLKDVNLLNTTYEKFIVDDFCEICSIYTRIEK